MRRTLVLATLALLAQACGGPDIEYYCEQTLDCTYSMIDNLGISKDTAQDLCEDATQDQYDTLSDKQQTDVEEAIDKCSSKKGCAFVTCLPPDLALLLVPDYGGADGQCGDDFADPDEDCDGSDLWGETCSSVTGGDMPGGTLSCNDDCTFDTSACM
jgi:hypothetical protein